MQTALAQARQTRGFGWPHRPVWGRVGGTERLLFPGRRKNNQREWRSGGPWEASAVRELRGSAGTRQLRTAGRDMVKTPLLVVFFLFFSF